MDTIASNDGQLRELALFAGAGGGILGGHLLGWRTVCVVEIEPYATGVLVARQNDGILPPFPVWDDVCTFDGRPWRGRVDVISGGFPCQDISIAGKGKGLEGERSGLWREMARIIGEVRPRFVLVENSPMLTVRGGARVIGDLAEMGYDCRWGIVSAADAGAPHRRERLWIIANADGERKLQPKGGIEEERRWVGNCRENMADADQIMRNGSRNARDGRAEFTDGSKTVADAESVEEREQTDKAYSFATGGTARDELIHRGAYISDSYSERREEQHLPGIPNGSGLTDRGSNEDAMADATHEGDVRRIRSVGHAEESHDSGRSAEDGRGEWWDVEPDVGRVADGVAARMDRLSALGNGQVPQAMALAWRTLTGGLI